MYPYTADLMCRDACRPVNPMPLHAVATVSTPLVIPAREGALKPPPGPGFLRGLRCGFRIGFDRSLHLQSASANMASAQLHPEVTSIWEKS